MLRERRAPVDLLAKLAGLIVSAMAALLGYLCGIALRGHLGKAHGGLR
jgi:hypothetical protein